MEKEIVISDVITNTNVGGISIASTREESQNAFGAPEFVDFKKSKIIVDDYFGGSLLIATQANSIILIAIYFEKGLLKAFDCQNQFAYGTFGSKFHNVKDTLNWLDDQRLKYEVRDAGSECTLLQLENSVQIGFNALGMLRTIQLSC